MASIHTHDILSDWNVEIGFLRPRVAFWDSTGLFDKQTLKGHWDIMDKEITG